MKLPSPGSPRKENWANISSRASPFARNARYPDIAGCFTDCRRRQCPFQAIQTWLSAILSNSDYGPHYNVLRSHGDESDVAEHAVANMMFGKSKITPALGIPSPLMPDEDR